MARKPDNRAVVSDPFARRLMVRYLAGREADIVALRTALADGDFDRIEAKGHKLFGSGSAYGLDRVSELGAALEKGARKKDRDAVAELIEGLDAYIRSVRVV